jgi:LysR family nitrogen assimilation transcriptional regulator
MTPRQLTYFLRIAELGSFSRAAAVLFVAQPALSRQIKQLEEELGVTLFMRSDSGARLTEAGELMASRSRELLQYMENLRSDVGALAVSVQGQFCFGMPPSLCDLMTVPLMEQYHHQYPAVRLSITEGISSSIYQQVLAGDLDAGIVSSTESMRGLESRSLITEPLVLAHPKGMDIEKRPDGAVELEQLVHHPLALTRSPNAMRVILDEELKRSGLKVKLLFESNSTRLLVKTVSRGLGCTVNPYSAMHDEHRSGTISLAPVHGLHVTWSLIYSRERSMPAAGQKLVELFQGIAQRHIAAGDWPGAVQV